MMDRQESILDCAKFVFKEEANALSQIADSLDANFEDIVNVLADCKGRIIVSGIGKSAIIGNKMVATFNSTGTPSVFMHAAESIHGDLGIVQENDLLILVSKSGESPEIKSLVLALKSWHNKIIALVCKKDSFLANEADYVLMTPVSKEACPNNLAPTTSTTAQLVMGDALAVCLMKIKGFNAEDFAKLHPGGNLGKRLLLRLSDIYPNNRNPRVSLYTPLKEVINSISQGRLGAVAVVDASDIVLGIITDGDIRRLLQKVDDIKSITAADFYTKGGYQAKPDLLAVNALDLMKKHDITQLMIADETQHFLGFVHIHDLVNEGLG